MENKTENDLFKNPVFPKLLIFGENKEYIRKVIEETVFNTTYLEQYIPINELEDKKRFYFYQDALNKSDDLVASHNVIEKAIELFGQDYRYEDSPHPINELQNRKQDNTTVGKK